MAYGILVASFNVEDFSLERLKEISREDLEFRLRQYERMLSFDAQMELPAARCRF